jgi:hypothetical protein
MFLILYKQMMCQNYKYMKNMKLVFLAGGYGVWTGDPVHPFSASRFIVGRYSVRHF